MADIRNQIVARRRALRMPQSLLAGAAQVSRSTVQRAERGWAISDENMRSLCAVLGITLGLESVGSADPSTAALMSDRAASPLAAIDDVGTRALSERPSGPAADGPHASMADGSGDPVGHGPEAERQPTEPIMEPHMPTMRSQPPLRRMSVMALPLCIGVALFGAAWSIKASAVAANESAERKREDEIRRMVEASDFPLTPRAGLAACLRAVSVKSCIDGQEASRREGVRLWRSASKELRRDCVVSSRMSWLSSTVADCLARDTL